VSEIIEFAVQIANEYLVPDGLDATLWEKLTGAERFYLKMLDIEATGARKLDNYQNFAKAFRVSDYSELMGAMQPNAARLKTAAEFKRDVFGDTAFGHSILRALLYALLLLQKEQDESDVLDQLHDLIQSSHHDGYHARRPQLVAMARYIATKRARTAPLEAQAARILEALLRNERLS
jgi:putative DNA methylase